MRKIITLGREFGSGGRELGKRLADELHIPCYDKEIIEMIAENEKLHPHFVYQTGQGFSYIATLDLSINQKRRFSRLAEAAPAVY